MASLVNKTNAHTGGFLIKQMHILEDFYHQTKGRLEDVLEKGSVSMDAV